MLVAEYQSAGRGRLDRSWTSPAGSGLTFSVLLRPEVALLRWGWLPLLAGVALAEAVTAFTGVEVALKWPNDLLVASEGDAAGSARVAGPGAKLAGILAQGGTDVVVIGIGVNVSTTAAELPVDTATSLALCGAPDIDRSGLLVEILSRLDARYAQWADVGGDALACGLAVAYRDRCATIGQLVTVATGETTGKQAIRGRAVDLDETGRLIVDAAGTRRAVGAGDVEHLRSV